MVRNGASVICGFFAWTVTLRRESASSPWMPTAPNVLRRISSVCWLVWRTLTCFTMRESINLESGKAESRPTKPRLFPDRPVPACQRGAGLVPDPGVTMTALTRQEQSSMNGLDNRASPVEVLLAYLEKSPIVQAVIRDLVNILKDRNLPFEERQWAETALQDALFRHKPAQPGKLKQAASAEEEKR